MRVLYDSDGLNEPVGGVSRYFAEMSRRLPVDIEPCFSCEVSRNAYFVDAPYAVKFASYGYTDFCPNFWLPSKYRLYRWFSRWSPWLVQGFEEANSRAFKRKLDEGGWDLVHLTGPHAMGRELDWTIAAGVPYVMTVHDLIPELLQRRKPARRAMALARASGIVAVSENTKRDLVRLYRVAEERITVIYHGAVRGEQNSQKDQSTVRCAGSESDGFILFVGKREGYKNGMFFLREMVPLLKSEPLLRVILTGQTLSAEERRIVEDGGVAGRVEARFVSDEELHDLYHRALCFVYPSEYEGFGIPILEAWQNGCPVVLSRASCFPEIGGNAALYFTPGDGEGLRSQIAETMKPAVREALIAKGNTRVKLFTWEKCAAETAKVYRRAVK